MPPRSSKPVARTREAFTATAFNYMTAVAHQSGRPLPTDARMLEHMNIVDSPIRGGGAAAEEVQVGEAIGPHAEEPLRATANPTVARER